MKMKNDIFNWKKNTTVIKSLYISTIPIQALAGALPIITSLVDSLMVGKFMEEYGLSTLGFVSPLILLLSAITGVLVSGAQFMSGRYLGEGNKERLNAVFSSTLLLCVLFGTALLVACLFVPKGLAILLGVSGEYIAGVSAYIRGISLNMLFSLISSCMIIFLQMEKKKSACTAAIVSMMVVNITGNAVNFIFLRWGMFGAGLFTSLGNMVAVAIEMTTILKTSKVFKFSTSLIQSRIFKEIFHIGCPSAVCTLLAVLRGTVVNHFLFSLGGATAISAFAVANTVSCFGSIVSNGCTGAANAVSGILVGNRDNEMLKNMTRICFKSTAWISFAAYLVIFIFAKQFALLFGAPIENIEVYIRFIRLFNIWFLTNTIIAVPCSIYQAMGKTVYISFVFSAAIVISLSISILLGNFWGIDAFVSVCWINEIFCMIILVITYYLKTHQFPSSVLELCYIPDTLSVPAENRYAETISNVADAVKASRDVVTFCIERGIPQKNSYYAGLCVEEISVDAAKHRIVQGKTAMDLRVFYENNDISILFRDNCPRFDPNEWLKLCNPADESRSLGIRIVSKIAMSTSYSYVMGLNELSINSIFQNQKNK